MPETRPNPFIKIKAFADKAGITISKLAELADVDESYIKSNDCTYKECIRIADVLGVDIKDFDYTYEHYVSIDQHEFKEEEFLRFADQYVANEEEEEKHKQVE